MRTRLLGCVAAAVAALSASALETTRATPIRHLRVNHVGYPTHGVKIVEADPSVTFDTYRVQCVDNPEITWRDVLSGTFAVGTNGFKYADISCITNPGDYRVVCGDVSCAAGSLRDCTTGLTSFPFRVYDGVYAPVERMLFTFFTWQRCGSPKGWAGRCHQDRVPLVGTDRTLDMRGGYHQSSDLRCWADDTARSVWLLFRWAERAPHPAWDDGDVDEELRWGAEYFAKLVGSEGWAYDCQFEPLGWGPRNYYLSPAPMTAQTAVLHVLAAAARRFKTSDPAFAAMCLAKAKAVFRQLETNPVFAKPYEQPIAKMPLGSQPSSFYSNVWCDNANGCGLRASAALEIYRTCGETSCRTRAIELTDAFLAFDDSTAFRSGCCGGADFGNLLLPRVMDATGVTKYREAFHAQCERFAREAEDLSAWTGGTSGRLSRALALMEGVRLFGERRYLAAAQRMFDWMLGVNRYEASQVTGCGHNQPPQQVWGQFFPSTPDLPGGVLHAMDGEYNLPQGGLMLNLANELESKLVK